MSQSQRFSPEPFALLPALNSNSYFLLKTNKTSSQALSSLFLFSRTNNPPASKDSSHEQGTHFLGSQSFQVLVWLNSALSMVLWHLQRERRSRPLELWIPAKSGDQLSCGPSSRKHHCNISDSRRWGWDAHP